MKGVREKAIVTYWISMRCPLVLYNEIITSVTIKLQSSEKLLCTGWWKCINIP
jgi:hypothetical protein